MSFTTCIDNPKTTTSTTNILADSVSSSSYDDSSVGSSQYIDIIMQDHTRQDDISTTTTTTISLDGDHHHDQVKLKLSDSNPLNSMLTSVHDNRKRNSTESNETTSEDSVEEIDFTKTAKLLRNDIIIQRISPDEEPKNQGTLATTNDDENKDVHMIDFQASLTNTNTNNNCSRNQGVHSMDTADDYDKCLAAREPVPSVLNALESHGQSIGASSAVVINRNPIKPDILPSSFSNISGKVNDDGANILLASTNTRQEFLQRDENLAAVSPLVEVVHGAALVTTQQADLPQHNKITFIKDDDETKTTITSANSSPKQSLGAQQLEAAGEQQQAPSALRSERSNSCSVADVASRSQAAVAAASIGAPNSSGSSLDRSISCSSSNFIDDANERNPSGAIISCQSQLVGRKLHQQQSQSSNKSDHDSSNNQATNNTSKQSQQSGGFFSSKLNTGSLWSLLGGGGGSITTDQQAEETKIVLTTNDNTSNQSTNNRNSQISIFERAVQFGKQGTDHHWFEWNDNSKQNSNNNQNQRETTTITRQQMGSSQAKPINSSSQTSSQLIKDSTNNQQQSSSSSSKSLKYRFTLKYVGSSMLHKNFTLSMLEWIAKDIRRHNLKNPKSQGRQFALRDIYLEIHENKFVALNVKDLACIFVHPMHCVTKYVQLQLDQNCFAYIIRDTRDLQQFVHVFQAKSANKVHEIFNALRETTAQIHQQLQSSSISSSSFISSSQKQQLANQALLNETKQSYLANSPPKSSNEYLENTRLQLQKQHSETLMNQPPALVQTGLVAQRMRSFDCNDLESAKQPLSSNQQSVAPTTRATSINIDNSYQFEVMFVKRVKLNCRRVPASFVDDALETLKSFEVLKINDSKVGQMKAKSRANIINGTVDEQQEYDEAATSQSNTNEHSAVGANKATGSVDEDDVRRNSLTIESAKGDSGAGMSRSCQHTPTKHQQSADSAKEASQLSTASSQDRLQRELDILKKHSSMESLVNGAKQSSTKYSNDFSPYNTITSSGLNERIAAIPVVSHGSVSLDHETRQRLARQVRQTIQATAANIKKDVYESGTELSNQLKSSLSLKAINSLSCTVASEVPSIESIPPIITSDSANNSQTSSTSSSQEHDNQQTNDATSSDHQDRNADVRRSSAAASGYIQQSPLMPGMNPMSSNNFDLFRRASARQVVKNRTMLLLIGKEELCTISIDKHQMLFSKSFSQIMHCLQGHHNRDHFGLICRDSNKIQPSAESYAGFIFKCQSDKVVREIMAALKQVIYNSQHNYDGYYSPYNPIHQTLVKTGNLSDHKHGLMKKLSTDLDSEQNQRQQFKQQQQDQLHQLASQLDSQQAGSGQPSSLAEKRGFTKPLDIDEVTKSSNHQQQSSYGADRVPATAPVVAAVLTPAIAQVKQPKLNIIKTMFCDNCPLYWFHRLCCDIESLPMDASKAIILRRIDSSLSEREQDDLYSKFSEYQIESIEDHNVIFMYLLRHLCESKQTKHAATSAHQAALARNITLLKQQQQTANKQQQPQEVSSSSASGQIAQQNVQSQQHQERVARFQHARSGSTSGAFVGAAIQNATDAAGAVAIDNLKRAKNTISVSIENMLKRRSSNPRENDDIDAPTTNTPVRSGSFRCASNNNTDDNRTTIDYGLRDTAATDSGEDQSIADSGPSGLKRSQSTGNSWIRDSFSRTMARETHEPLANPFVDFFRRKSGNQATGDQSNRSTDDESKYANYQQPTSGGSTRTSTECLSVSSGSNHSTLNNKLYVSPKHCNTPSESTNQFSPPSMLSSVFWKKSLFDKIRQPELATTNNKPTTSTPAIEPKRPKRTRQELRDLWKKAVLEQITLIKMDAQNQRLASSRQAANIRSKSFSSSESNKPRSSSLVSNRVVDDTHNERLIIDNNPSNDPVKIKLNYKEIPHSREANACWDRLLKQDAQRKVDFVEVARMVRLGVPKLRRGEIWMFLMNQYQLRHGTSYQPADEFQGDANQPYRGLLTQLSVQQHEIFVDIGRTFPSHPYYSQYLSIGQLSLFNLLKAYSLLDQEVGYCQGLSFVAGILLLHVDTEDEAFELMRHLLLNFGLRRQYLPSMNALHLQLYQLTRLLRDHEYALFNHFDRYDISPTLYAAPWFLTLFASQFSLGYVARLLDLILLIGIEAIFRISLNLLAYHRDTILSCKGIESTMEFLKSELVNIEDKDLVKIFDKSFSLDLRNELLEYEIEYTFYCAEDHRQTTNPKSSHSARRSNPENKSNVVLTNNKSNMNQDKTATGKLTQGRSECEDSAKDDKCETTKDASQSEGQSLRDEDKHRSLEAKEKTIEQSTSKVADATATVIIQHLLANNHLKPVKSNHTYY